MTTSRPISSACWAAIVTVITSIGYSPSPASADLYNIGVTADAYIAGGASADTAFGLVDKLFVGTEDGLQLDKARKFFLRFDVSQLSADALSASLQLTLESDAPSTTETIHLYGINDGVSGEDSWGETTFTWNNAPANDTSSYFELTSDATLLTTFTVPSASSSSGDSFLISDPDLATFLNNDTNGWVTFVLTASRRGTSSNPYDLFKIASRENGSFAGPALIASTPEPTSLAMMGIVFLGLITNRLRRVSRLMSAHLSQVGQAPA